jgi:Leucine-rich repeat (LRR) protein
VSLTFSILIVIIIAGVFLFPNILGSLSLLQYESFIDNELKAWDASIEKRDEMLIQSLQELDIKDENFYVCAKKALSNFMGVHPKNINESSASELIKYLSCRNMGIKSIIGAENLKNLTYIDLTRNPIVDISPLSDLENLYSIDLTGVTLNDNRTLFELEGIGKVSPPNLSDVFCADITIWIKSRSLKIAHHLDDKFDCKGGDQNRSRVEKIIAKMELGYEVSNEEKMLVLESKLNEQKNSHNEKYGN